MRRKIMTIVVVLAVLLSISAIEQIVVNDMTDDALADVAVILDLLRAGDLSTALEKSRQLDVTWDERASRAELIIDHSTTDDVRFALSRLIAALEGEDRASALIYASELEGGVEHVQERQALIPQNLL